MTAGASRWANGACVAGLAAGVLVVVFVLALRVANPGFEPEGRDWWLTVQLMLGCCYLPVGLWFGGPTHGYR